MNKDGYYSWLLELVSVNQDNKSYYLLCLDLYKREFYWTVPNDDNRATDGKKLRSEFGDDVLEGPCTVLEMLVGLSKRIVFIMEDVIESNTISYWFWKILSNLGLDIFTDDKYVDLNGSESISTAMDNVLERNYRRNGQGGLFPLKLSKKDQRKVEIWYQMAEYLNENYYKKEEIA